MRAISGVSTRAQPANGPIETHTIITPSFCLEIKYLPPFVTRSPMNARRGKNAAPSPKQGTGTDVRRSGRLTNRFSRRLRDQHPADSPGRAERPGRSRSGAGDGRPAAGPVAAARLRGPGRASRFRPSGGRLVSHGLVTARLLTDCFVAAQVAVDVPIVVEIRYEVGRIIGDGNFAVVREGVDRYPIISIMAFLGTAT